MSPGKGKSRNGSRKRVSERALLAAVPDMMFRMSRDGTILDYKPAKGLEPYLPPDEFLGQRMGDVLPANVGDDYMRLIEKTIVTGESQEYTYQLSIPDGIHTYEVRIVWLLEDEVLAIVRDLTARAKHFNLTPREIVILRLVAAGLTDKEISERLGTSPLTVRKQVQGIRRKMDAVNRTEIAVMGLREGLIK